MSELREECYKCLNNQNCISGADYGSFYCMTRRKFKMPENEENNSVYATKFATMKKEIDEKNKRIKELQKKLENSIPKQKVKDKIEALEKMFEATNKGILQEYTVEEIIIKINTLRELLEEGANK